MIKRFLILFLAALFLTLSIGTSDLSAKIKVGEEISQLAETQHPYTGKKGLIWEKTFTYPDAGYISIHFSSFDLAKGDYIEVSSPDGHYLHVYEGKGKKVMTGETLSNFWASYIPGDTAIVRLVGKNKRSGYGVVIDKWVRGYERGYIEAVMNGLETLNDFEALCGSDDKEWAKCYLGTEMYNKSKAVCRLLINGSSACTGWLLGSEGHIMTNEHCIGSQSDASNTDYEFMAEGATCTTSCSSWFACPGTVEATSGSLIQVDSSLDYALVLLPSNVTSTYGYLQLRSTLPILDERIYLPQHPSAYGKMLAVESDVDGPYAKIYSTNETPCAGGPGDIGYYADTAGGSSGSPVIAYTDNLVVALHHCANCPNRGVPIPSIISDLGTNLPANAIGGAMAPTADFSGNPTSGNVNLTVNFTDLSTGSPTSWLWNFGDTGTSAQQNPSHTYTAAGSYTVSLTATNANGSDTETKTNYITVTVPTVPVANFTASATNIVTGQSVTFTDTSTNIPTSWTWSFEGGTPTGSTVQNPSVTYNTAGIYDVSLTATNSAGSNTETKTDYITVTDAPLTVGNTTVYGSTSVSGNRRAMPFTMPENGTIHSIAMYHAGGSGNVILAVYDGTSSAPANRIAVTPSTPISSSAGFQTINLSSSVYVNSGATIWLAWVFENNPGIAYQTGSPGRADSGTTWSSGMPVTFGSSTVTSYQYSIYANYTAGGTPIQYTLTANTSGQGSVSLSPTGGTYISGTTVTLTATADSGWQFSGWSGDLSGTANPATIVMNSDKTVTATFTQITGTGDVGNTSIYSSSSVSGNRRAMPFTMPENGTIQSISMYHAGGSGDMILAVYDGSSTPQNRIAITPVTAVSGSTGWQTINLTTPIYVSSGTTIWLAWVYENNPGIRYATGTPGRYDSGLGWSSGMPVIFGSGSQVSYIYSIYATYTK